MYWFTVSSRNQWGPGLQGSVGAGQRRREAEVAPLRSSKATSLGYVDREEPDGEEFRLPGH